MGTVTADEGFLIAIFNRNIWNPTPQLTRQNQAEIKAILSDL
ncbi:MAG: hypothetical protein ACXV8U_12170 [Methylobacter sp.]